MGVYIDAFAIVEENTEIGDNTTLHPHSIVRNGSRIGNRCNIHPGAVIGGIPQDLKFKNEETLAIIYWPFVTAIYLGYSFLTNDWTISWIVWVVAGLLYPVLTQVLRSFKKRSITKG